MISKSRLYLQALANSKGDLPFSGSAALKKADFFHISKIKKSILALTQCFFQHSPALFLSLANIIFQIFYYFISEQVHLFWFFSRGCLAYFFQKMNHRIKRE